MYSSSSLSVLRSSWICPDEAVEVLEADEVDAEDFVDVVDVEVEFEVEVEVEDATDAADVALDEVGEDNLDFFLVGFLVVEEPQDKDIDEDDADDLDDDDDDFDDDEGNDVLSGMSSALAMIHGIETISL